MSSGNTECVRSALRHPAVNIVVSITTVQFCCVDFRATASVRMPLESIGVERRKGHELRPGFSDLPNEVGDLFSGM